MCMPPTLHLEVGMLHRGPSDMSAGQRHRSVNRPLHTCVGDVHRLLALLLKEAMQPKWLCQPTLVATSAELALL